MTSQGGGVRMQELRAFVGLTDEDSARIAAHWPQLAPELPDLVDGLLGTLLAREPTRAALGSAELPARLRASLHAWLGEQAAGPHDDAYLERRRAAGRDHLEDRLEPRLLVVVVGSLRGALQAWARRAGTGSEGEALADSLGRLCDLELALQVGTFAEAQEARGLAELRESIVSHLPMSVILLDTAGRVTTSSRASPRVFRDASPNGKPWADVLQPALAAEAHLDQRIERARSLGREILLPRVDVVQDSGPASFRVTVTPLRHPMAEVLLHVEDLTDTLASESRATRAEQLSKLATMAATVAHEIRNPLAGVSAAVQVVASTLGPDDARRAALAKVQEQVQRLGNLVGDLLSLSKPIAMNLREVDLVALARSVADGEHGTVTVEGTGSAMADAALLTQALFNLEQNAWQAGARSVRVVVEGATLRVIDDGPGVAPELREKIFEPFFTTKTRGTGLGLPTARKIVEAMGGTLRVCEGPLGGACFEVALQQQHA